MEADVILIQYTFNPRLKWFLRVLWHSREPSFSCWPCLLVTLWQCRSSVWWSLFYRYTLVWKPWKRSDNEEFAHSEPLRHRGENMEKRGECGQISALGVNSFQCIWDRGKTESEDKWKKHHSILAKKKKKIWSQAESQDRFLNSSLFPLQTLKSPKTKI